VIQLRFEAEIQASAEGVFALLSDLRAYDRWLPRSRTWRGTSHITSGPTRVGTTYVEPGPFGVRHGRVTEFDPPTRLGFEQPMTSRHRALGVIGIRLANTLTPHGRGVRLRRDLELEARGPARVAMPLLVAPFRAENARIIRALKAFAEQEARAPDDSPAP
jgi:uncharacterized protein YndB with AHSA1/START domain